MAMNLRKLYYFVSVAKHLNFTKAAKENHIVQTAISQQISDLEKQLGVKLFNRNSRHVELTPAGKIFLDEITYVLDRYEDAIQKVKQAAAGTVGNLSISYWGTNPIVIVPQLIEKFHYLYSNTSISVIQKPYLEAIDLLMKGLLDFAFVDPCVVQGYNEIQYKTVKKSSLYIVVNKKHRLAKKAKVKPQELEDENFIIVNMPDYLKVIFIDHCAQAGFTPNIIMQPKEFTEVILLVEAGMGITVLPDCGNQYFVSNLVCLELEGCEACHEVGVAWSQNNKNPYLQCFLKILNEQQK
jgi:DNA-binding transcriptional LysR family regulator